MRRKATMHKSIKPGEVLIKGDNKIVGNGT